MTTFYLIRHGDKYAIPPDPDLNGLGKTQAEDVAQFLSQFPITKIVSSPLKRSQQTAAHTASILKLPVQTDIRLRERINWGDDPTLDRDAFIQFWKETTLDRDYVPEFGNTSRQTGENIQAVIQEYADLGHEHVALFTHGGAIADFLRNILPETQLADIKVVYPDGYDYEVHECSVTVVTLDAKTNQISVLNMNQTGHLRRSAPDINLN